MTPFTRSQQDAIAGVLMSLRGEGNMNAHRQMLNWVTDAMSVMLAENSEDFSPSRFGMDAGRYPRAS